MKSSNTIKTTFGTELKLINKENGLFTLKVDTEVPIDAVHPSLVGTKKLFKEGGIVSGNFWMEIAKNGKTRKVVMVNDENQAIGGGHARYLINKNYLKPTTVEEVEAKKEKEEIEKSINEVKSLLDEVKEDKIDKINKNISPLEREYLGFSVKQILAASLGVIVLIKIFK